MSDVKKGVEDRNKIKAILWAIEDLECVPIPYPIAKLIGQIYDGLKSAIDGGGDE